MKLPVLAILAFMAAAGDGIAGPAMPPDPLMQRLVPVPFTAADLIVEGFSPQGVRHTRCGHLTG